MKFSYDQYKEATLLSPLTFVIIGILIVSYCLYYMIKSNNSIVLKIVKNVFLIWISLFISIPNIIVLKYGIHLFTESEADTTDISGIVENIVNFKQSPRYTTDDNTVLASIITISGEEYYFMSGNNIEIGSSIEIQYLPKSRIVLEWQNETE